MKKLILSLDVHDEKGKQKAMKAVSGISGIDSISIDIKEKKLTVIGDVDPVVVVGKLRKKLFPHTGIVSVGPAKEPEKKKEEPKKEEAKKEEAKKDDKKTQEEKISELVNAYRAYNPHYTKHYYVRSMEENPNACVIC